MIIDNNVLHLKPKYTNKYLSRANPCQYCEIFIKYETKQMYSPAEERENLSLPDSCNSCEKMIRWTIDCLKKLAWYEEKERRSDESDK